MLDYLSRAGGRQATQRELESIIAAILPVQLWREFREGDLIQLMRMRGGLLIQVGDKMLPISSQSFKLESTPCVRNWMASSHRMERSRSLWRLGIGGFGLSCLVRGN